MHFVKLSSGLLIANLIIGSPAALACHELVVTTGKGLATQAYIAPNPANVLILYADASHDREYAGLDLAGHRLTFVENLSELAEELAANEYDIVIAPLDLIDTVDQQMVAQSSARVVPIVSRDMRRSTDIRDRFDQYLVDGTGVAKFLTVINRVMAS